MPDPQLEISWWKMDELNPCYSRHVFFSHQIVNLEFEGGVTAAFTMVAFTEEICQRKTTIYGSKVARKHSEAHTNRKQCILLNAAFSELRHTCALGWTVSVHPRPKPCF